MTRREELIEMYHLAPLEGEGGFYRFIDTFGSNCGRIFFLMTEAEFSHLHLLSEDEAWFFLEGDPVEQITARGDEIRREILGRDHRSTLVRASWWQTSFISRPSRGYSFLSTVMSPRFEKGMYTGATEEILRAHPFLKEYA